MKNKLSVAYNLTDEEYNLLLYVYAKHNSTMGLTQRKNYMLENIVKFESNKKENCLNVYYENGEWWHYTYDGTWY